MFAPMGSGINQNKLSFKLKLQTLEIQKGTTAKKKKKKNSLEL